MAKDTKKPGDDMPRKYHLVLSDGSQRDITSVYMEVHPNGVLSFENANGEVVVVYASGTWAAVEAEARDDRG